MIAKESRINRRIWFHGLGAAFIGGFAAATAALVLGDGLKKSLELGAVAGLTASLAYLKQSPLPALPKEWKGGESI